jgi:hypothetical protein
MNSKVFYTLEILMVAWMGHPYGISQKKCHVWLQAISTALMGVVCHI